MKKKLSELAAELSATHNGFDLVTVNKRKYYVYRYKGNLNGIENAVVLLSYPEKAFGNPKALRAFISTNVDLSTQEILKNKYNSLLLELSIFSSCLSEMVYETGCEIIYKKFKFLQKILQVFFCFGRSEYLKYK